MYVVVDEEAHVPRIGKAFTKRRWYTAPVGLLDKTTDPKS
jgi:hypothetical protein